MTVEDVKKSSKGVLIALLFGICSASMAFANKAVLNSYNYDYPITLVMVQMIVSIGMLETLRMFNQISIPSFTIARGQSFLLPSLCYAINCVLALTALSDLNIPMYGLIKRCSPLVILGLGTLLLGKGLPSCPVVCSVAMVTSGCFIAGYGDLAFDLRAYVFGFASVFSQSIYLVLVQKSAQSLSAVETLHLNSYNTLPLLVFLWLAFGESQPSIASFNYHDTNFVLMVILVVVMGVLLNFMLFLCTLYNSALTTSLTGSIKSIVQTVIGMFTFGGISINVFTVTGIVVNLTGGIVYSFAKYRESQAKLSKAAQIKSEPAQNGHAIKVSM